ncbi:myoneurin-like isoform X2 [Sitophilus oryzae]|uniref:Myoneurin-like isoform X2 n=1 Tax=Sitophilus oryzae TaxID=7048 RepID=A0A6J2X4A6_SITOR|nr:myoneurin-like isoform X2 [Sitophilus oryzae]
MTVICEICRLKLPTAKILISHYLCNHSKFKLACEILRLSVLKSTPKVLSKQLERKTNTKSNRKRIRRDDKSAVDMEFSFEEKSSKSQVQLDNKEVKLTKLDVNSNSSSNNIYNECKSVERFRNTVKLENKKCLEPGLNISSSSISSEDTVRKILPRKRIKKRKDVREKTRHYKINITTLKTNESFNEITGNFYYCTCRDDNKNKVNLNSLKLTSDTESASDNAKTNTYDPKVFCSKCGNGYREERMLLEHMKIHETHCRVCNEIFPTEQLFKQHIENHMFKVFVCHLCNFEFPVKQMLHNHFHHHFEDSVLDTVIDLENDYNLTRCFPTTLNYQTSINDILYYLREGQQGVM